MFQFRFARTGLLLAALGLNTASALLGVTSVAYAQAGLRPEIGKPLKDAENFIKSKKFKEALAKIHETDAVGGKTPTETSTIESLRAYAAQASGDNATAAHAYETVIESGHLPPGEQLKRIQALASIYYQLHDYSKATTWLSRYQKEGGTDPAMHELLIQTYYLSNNFALAGKEAQAEVQAAEKAGRAPTEEQLNLWASCALKQGDKAGYAAAMEKMVAYHPTKQSWASLLSRVQSKPGFSDRLALDVYRLKLALGQLQSSSDYMEVSLLTLQAGFPAEAKKIIDDGFKSGALGTGTDADRHKRLRDMAIKKTAEIQQGAAQAETDASASKDGTALLNLGYAQVTAGQFDKGISLMEQGLRKSETKHPEDAKLHLALAYLQAGQKAKALQMLRTVQGKDGTADLARYWTMQINHPMS